MRYEVSKYLEESERILMSASSFSFLCVEAGEVAQWLEALPAPTQDLGSVPAPLPGHSGNQVQCISVHAGKHSHP